ncbi:MAG TPA: CocE/NonD family hydrolase [Gemmatimonadales bacterium]|nr:CocE/NonD family hydrolase [Gemmatimonadales bacterium]
MNHLTTTRWLALAILCAACNLEPAPPVGSEDLSRQFDRQEVRIPMRDGVELFTVILTPKRADGALPFILSRTPYGTAGWGGTYKIGYGFQELMKDGYIFVFQDIRGRFQSGGTFVMNRPACLERGDGCVDEATDTWDTVEWLLKNVPDNNGRVGQLGISYPGWNTNATAFEPHPAIKALSPQATMGDVWMGDDFFHQGAFRLSYGLEYAWDMEASSDQSIPPTPGRYDTYDWYLSFPTLKDLSAAVGADAWPTWRLFATHPAYDTVWSTRSIPARLKSAPVPTLNVGGWWDQEDIYGTPNVYAAMETHDSAHLNFLVVGPWYHGEWFLEAGDSLGAVRFGSATGETYRRTIEAPWFAYWLKDKGDGNFPEARVFDAGAQQWRTFDAWPAPTSAPRQLYLHDGGKLSFDPPTATSGYDQYVSDPARPVPYRHRPIERTYDPRGSDWDCWMTEDQRFVDSRPDVLVWQTEPLAEEVTVAGSIAARLFASTTGTDADWVVKLIDVYPDSIADRPRMGGFELMVVGEIMRGRYYKGWDNPLPIPANTVTPFSVDLHQQAYTFRPGHRIMVHVQSTWFPVHDRNPQTFVPNIFEAKASDFRVQTHRIYRSAQYPSHLELDVLGAAQP